MSTRTVDRRGARRHQRVEDHRIVGARVRPGARVRIVDVSARGTLVETTHRLLPGAVVELEVETGDRQATLAGRVLRCSVSKVCSMYVCYRGAIQFDRPVSWLLDEPRDGKFVHPTESSQTRHARAETTRP